MKLCWQFKKLLKRLRRAAMSNKVKLIVAIVLVILMIPTIGTVVVNVRSSLMPIGGCIHVFISPGGRERPRFGAGSDGSDT